MTRKAYPCDVTDQEWQIIEPLLPGVQDIGRPRQVDLREIVNGIFYVLREGCSSRVRYRMTYPLGKRCITTFGIGNAWGYGRKSTVKYETKFVNVWRKQTNLRRASSIVSR